MTKPYEIRTVALEVGQNGDTVCSDGAMLIEIIDEGAGEFIRIMQVPENERGYILVGPEDWPALREAADRLIAECRPAPDVKNKAG